MLKVFHLIFIFQCLRSIFNELQDKQRYKINPLAFAVSHKLFALDYPHNLSYLQRTWRRNFWGILQSLRISSWNSSAMRKDVRHNTKIYGGFCRHLNWYCHHQLQRRKRSHFKYALEVAMTTFFHVFAPHKKPFEALTMIQKILIPFKGCVSLGIARKRR